MRVERIGVVAVSALGLIFGMGPPAAIAGAGDRQAATTSIEVRPGQPVAGSPVRPASAKNCGTVTCSVYYSKSETVELKKRLDGGGAQEAFNAVCAALGLAGGRASSVCSALAANNALRTVQLKQNVDAAVNRRGCAVIRHNFLIQALPYSLNAAAISFGNVAGGHRFCTP